MAKNVTVADSEWLYDDFENNGSRWQSNNELFQGMSMQQKIIPILNNFLVII